MKFTEEKLHYLNFFKDGCTYQASALTITTLLAIVPTLWVMISSLSLLPNTQVLLKPLQNYIFSTFLPESGRAIQDYVLGFISKAGQMSIIGLLFLFATSLLLIHTIESALNKIWKVKRPRLGANAFVVYWAILSIAPLMLALSIVISSYVFSVSWFSWQHSAMNALFLKLMPYALSWLGFSFLYYVVPNRNIKFRHAAVSGLFTAFCFESAKYGFSLYVHHFPTYEFLYGAFASIPIVILWIYWVWLITLLGAEVNYSLNASHYLHDGELYDGFHHAISWLYQLWLAQQSGHALSIEELTQRDNHRYEIYPEEMLEQLTRLHLIQYTFKKRYVLAQNLNNISLYQLIQMLPYPLRYQPYQVEEHWHAALNPLLQSLDKQQAQQANISLEELFSRGIG